MTFDDFGLSDDLLAAIKSAGYETPTPIQEKAIPPALMARDVLGIAQTGTGKTAGFALPLIERLARGRSKARMARSLILEPTRELAAQVAENITTYTTNHRLSMALLIGGVSFSDQNQKLDRGVDILIATPGRLLDHFERGKLMLNGVEVFVVDEADRMLDMGFIPDIDRIFSLLPFTRQTLFFSATMPPEIQGLTEKYLHNPVRVEASRPASTAETVTQKICVVSRANKRQALRRIMQAEEVTNGIIFCNTKRSVDILRGSLDRHGFSVGALHGDLDQRLRMQILDQFKNGELTFLVASDVAARGLDIPAVSHVFNFDIPTHAEDYVHRIGRTGRAGRSGSAFTIMTPADGKYLEAVEGLIGRKIDPVDDIDVADLAAGEEDAEEDRGARRRRGRRRSGGGRPEDGGGQQQPEGRSEARSERRTEARSEDRSNERAESQASDKRGANDSRREDRASRQAKEETGERKRGRSRRRDRRRDEDDTPVVGLGDHVPAFLLRPTPLPRSRPAQKDETAEASDRVSKTPGEDETTETGATMTDAA